MPESQSAPLLDSVDGSAPHLIEEQTDVHANRAPASSYFRPLIRIFAIFTFVSSIISIALLIAAYIIVKIARLGNSSTWMTQEATKALANWMSLPLVVSGISALINFPILLNVVVEAIVLTRIIPRVIDLFGGLPNSRWCQQFPYPGQPPVPSECMHWKSVIKALMGFAAGFALLVCVLYVVQLLLRGIAIFKTKLWRKPLSWALPKEININFSMKVRRQEQENGEGSGHGPVYLS